MVTPQQEVEAARRSPAWLLRKVVGVLICLSGGAVLVGNAASLFAR